MAFRRDALIEIGGFDPALGAGTATRAAEDTAAFADLMLLDYKVMYGLQRSYGITTMRTSMIFAASSAGMARA